MQNIIYIDYDGVLHPDAAYRSIKDSKIYLDPTYTQQGLDLFCWANILSHILIKYNDVKIVLSTSWVPTLGFNKAKSYLPGSLQSRVIGATYHSGMKNPTYAALSYGDSYTSGIPFSNLTRFEQIYGDVKRRNPANWIAIDDLGDGTQWPNKQADRLIQPNGEKGISDSTVINKLRIVLDSWLQNNG